jgi:hypothetical protein
MKIFTPDPLDLFLHAHFNGAHEAERCLGLVEKRLSGFLRTNLLLGCKSALLLIVQNHAGLAENDQLYRRNALQIARKALKRSGKATAQKIRLMNGLAWARLLSSDPDRRHAFFFLHALEDPGHSDQLPPLAALEGFVALSAVYHDQGRLAESVRFFRKACRIDRERASNRFEAFLCPAKQGREGTNG